MRLAAAWCAQLRARSDAPPLRERLPLAWRGQAFGSVEESFVEALGHPLLTMNRDGCEVLGEELTRSLGELAQVMRERGFTSAWRDESFAVHDEAGTCLGTIERAAVRPLGITTHAVHLAACDGQGRHWIQRRASDKSTDPGLLDTLVGGGIPVGESVETALERETWEESGLRIAQLRALRHGGRVLTRRPAAVPHGYIVEWLEWYTGVLPDDLVPANQDGEVAEFLRLDGVELAARLERDAFTIDAALVLQAAAFAN